MPTMHSQTCYSGLAFADIALFRERSLQVFTHKLLMSRQPVEVKEPLALKTSRPTQALFVRTTKDASRQEVSSANGDVFQKKGQV